MNYLLDTHALLWFLFDDPQLPQESYELTWGFHLYTNHLMRI